MVSPIISRLFSALIFLFFVSCDQERAEERSADEIESIKESPATHYGKTVTVVGEIETVFDSKAFRAESMNIPDEIKAGEKPAFYSQLL